MTLLQKLFASPEWYPVLLDTKRRVIQFVRMSPETYRSSVFLDLRTRHLGQSIDVALDDLLLAAACTPAPQMQVHYILNTAYCCSTLLSRYFELIPSCFVLKEPRLLSQVAVAWGQGGLPWESIFALCLRLLCRTYECGQMVVMKPVDCCSLIGNKLLDHNHQATVTFLMTPLRQFLLSVLKAGERREWVKLRIRGPFKNVARSVLGDEVECEQLSVAEAAVCLWLGHRFLCEQICSGPHRARVHVVSGSQLADTPEKTLAGVASLCGLPLNDGQIQQCVFHPSVHTYSKDLTRPYDAASREQELAELERCWAAEADAGLSWARRHGWQASELPSMQAWSE